jgi:hypothetical protein
MHRVLMAWCGSSLWLLAALLLLPAAGQVARGEIRPEFAMHTDPELPRVETLKVVSEKFAPLWAEALARPEADLQRLTAEAISQGYVGGIPGLEALIPQLKKLVAADATDLTTRRAVAQALITMEALDSASILFDVSKRYGADMRQVIEPALARWKFADIRETWLTRLESPGTRARDLHLAIEGLAVSGDSPTAVPLLTRIAMDPFRSRGIRLAASRAAGQLQSVGLEDAARRLVDLTGSGILHRLCAIALLERHDSAEARALLQSLADHAEPAVAAAALTRLNAIDHDLVLPFAEKALQSGDAKIRQQGVDCFLARPTPERLALVAKRLDDFDPDVRGSVREGLFQLAAQPELKDSILAGAMLELAGESWRGQEQSALLLGALDHKPAAQRLVEVLESKRGEVMVATAWALRKLAVRETLPAILDKAQRQTDLRKRESVVDLFDTHVAHLFEALGLMNYTEAEPLLRMYVPKDLGLGLRSRPAAIWALGKMHAGAPDEPLAKLMAERLTDTSPFPPEMEPVRVACAVSLARMNAQSQLPAIRKFLGPKVAPVGHALAMRWAIHQMTGELLPMPDPVLVSRANFYLESLDNPLDELVPAKR